MFIVYNVKTERMYKAFETERGAKISKAAMNRKAGDALYDYMGDAAFERFMNPMVTVKSIGGKEVQIPKQTVGTCCDPSTETFWSM